MASDKPLSPALEARRHWARSASPSPEDMKKDVDVSEKTVEAERDVMETTAQVEEDSEAIEAISEAIASARSAPLSSTMMNPETREAKFASASRRLGGIKRKLADLAEEVDEVTRGLGGEGDDGALRERKRRRGGEGWGGDGGEEEEKGGGEEERRGGSGV